MTRHAVLDPIIRTESDREGRFELSGVGLERLASVEILAEGQAADQVYVVSRQSFDAGKYNRVIQEFETPFARQHEMFPRRAGPDSVYIAEPELLIHGKVFSGPDQTPVSPAVVHSYGRGQGQMLLATSDEQGRYELHGVPRNRKWPVSAAPPAGGDFLPGVVTLGGSPGQAAIDVDLELKRGIVVEGRLFDQIAIQDRQPRPV